MKLVQRNDESVLGVAKDLLHAKDAELVVLDSLCGDVKTLKDEITPVYETAKKQADELEGKGELKQLSSKELREQKTSIRNVANVPQYNKIDHLTGRTIMERFAINAKATIDDALDYTDTVREKFMKLLGYFGEDLGMPSNEFFKTWTQFMTEFGKAIEHVMLLEKMQVSFVFNDSDTLVPSICNLTHLVDQLDHSEKRAAKDSKGEGEAR